MILNFAAALDALGPDAAFTYANEVRPPAWYLFNQLLPERNVNSYNVKSGSMTVRSVMAGLAGMDSPYPPTGVMEVSTFLEETAKIANNVELPEGSIRIMQDYLRNMGQNDGLGFIQNEALNFLNKVVLQAHIDAMEWLRGQALVSGAINWDFNEMNLTVDYGIPAANVLANRTGTDAWDSTTSKFWEDIRSLQSILDYNVRALIMHPTTLVKLIDNDVNKIEMVSQSDMGNGSQRYTFRRVIGTTERLDSDFRSTIDVIAYGLEAEKLDLTNLGQTTKIPFMQSGKILAVGNPGRSGYRVGEGSVDDPYKSMEFGYTHIAPTVEGGGQAGRWAQLFVPEQLPMQLHARGVTNGLPVIEVPEKIAIASSDLS